MGISDKGSTGAVFEEGIIVTSPGEPKIRTLRRRRLVVRAPVDIKDSIEGSARCQMKEKCPRSWEAPFAVESRKEESPDIAVNGKLSLAREENGAARRSVEEHATARKSEPGSRFVVTLIQSLQTTGRVSTPFPKKVDVNMHFFKVLVHLDPDAVNTESRIALQALCTRSLKRA